MNRRVFLSAMLAAAAARAAPAPKIAPGGLVVLDDSDEAFRGKLKYEDNLSFLDHAGKITKHVTGLNMCQEIGNPHRIAIDPVRKNVWVAETVGGRVLRYDLTGKELSAIASVPNASPYAIAIDPKTGDAWVTRHGTTAGCGIDIYTAKGEHKAYHVVQGGYDLAYDAKGKAIWLVGRDLVKVSLDGKELLRQKVSTWYGVTVAVDAKSGTVWVGAGRHSGIKDSKDELLRFDNAGKLISATPLDSRPMRIVIDPGDSSLWMMVGGKAVARWSADLKKQDTFPLRVLSLDVKGTTGNVWVATPDEIGELDRKGKFTARAKQKARTQQAWLASW